MDKAAEALDFEAAALIRDRIRALSLVQGHQDIHVAGIVDADVIAALPGRRPHLRPGVLFPRRPQLGQPRLFPEPRPPACGRGGADRLCRPVLRQPAEAAAACCSATGWSSRSWSQEALSLRGGRVDARGAAARRQEEAGRPHRRDRRARRSAAGSPKAPRSASCSTASPRPSAWTAPLEPHRGLRQQPHPGQPRGRRDDRRRPRRADEERLPQIHHPRPVTDSRCADAPLPASGGGATDARESPAQVATGRSEPAGGDDYAMMREVFRRRFGRALEGRPGARPAGCGPTWC